MAAKGKRDHRMIRTKYLSILFCALQFRSHSNSSYYVATCLEIICEKNAGPPLIQFEKTWNSIDGVRLGCEASVYLNPHFSVHMQLASYNFFDEDPGEEDSKKEWNYLGKVQYLQVPAQRGAGGSDQKTIPSKYINPFRMHRKNLQVTGLSANDNNWLSVQLLLASAPKRMISMLFPLIGVPIGRKELPAFMNRSWRQR